MSRSPHVLVCHADAAIRDRLAAGLSAAGMTVETVSDPTAVIERLASADAVVAGHSFPDSNGLALLADVRERYPHCPFVLVPTAGNEAVASEAFAAASDYVPLDDDVDEAQIDRIEAAITDGHATDAARYRALIEHSTDLVAILGPEGAFQYASPSVETILGYDPDALVGDLAFEYVHEDDREAVMGKFFDAIEDPAHQPIAEFRFRNAAGDWRVIEARGKNRLADPAVEGFVVNARDVTERRQRERELRTERALTEGILETIPDLVYAFDHAGDPIRPELVGAEIPGYSDEEVQTGDPLEFVPAADRDALGEAIGRVLEEGTVETVESAIVTGDGERIPHEFNGARLTDENGTVIGLVGAARDISDRLEYERKLERQNDRLEEFALVVSHDLRNPLNVIGGHLELARKTGDPEHLEAIEAAAGRMEAMITDLLSLARQGRTIGDLDDVGVQTVAGQAWSGVETGDAALRFDGDATVAADAERLCELFENLFRNAVEHGSPAPDRPGADLTITVGTLPDGFYVGDDGAGIPPAERELVLEHGFTSREGGTGLGLAIVQRIVEAHGWDLRITEGTDGGARFEIVDVEVGATDERDPTGRAVDGQHS